MVGEDSILAGFHVPKGHGAVYMSHVHRDPEVFQQPDSFLQERWSGRNAGQEHFLPSFGCQRNAGSCIGVQLTNVFLKEVCMYLLKPYDWWLDPPSQDLEYKWLPVSPPNPPPPHCVFHPTGSDITLGWTACLMMDQLSIQNCIY
ncbi:LOW QUALITY PROTEIN: cytochrome P450 11B2, mitochondrial-like [Xenentodon cancila]